MPRAGEKLRDSGAGYTMPLGASFPRNREIEATLRLLLPLRVSLSFSKGQDKGVIGTTDSFLLLKLSEVSRRTPARQMRRDTWLKGSSLWFDGTAPSTF